MRIQDQPPNFSSPHPVQECERWSVVEVVHDARTTCAPLIHQSHQHLKRFRFGQPVAVDPEQNWEDQSIPEERHDLRFRDHWVQQDLGHLDEGDANHQKLYKQQLVVFWGLKLQTYSVSAALEQPMVCLLKLSNPEEHHGSYESCST